MYCKMIKAITICRYKFFFCDENVHNPLSWLLSNMPYTNYSYYAVHYSLMTYAFYNWKFKERYSFKVRFGFQEYRLALFGFWSEGLRLSLRLGTGRTKDRIRLLSTLARKVGEEESDQKCCPDVDTSLELGLGKGLEFQSKYEGLLGAHSFLVLPEGESVGLHHGRTSEISVTRSSTVWMFACGIVTKGYYFLDFGKIDSSCVI